MVKRRNRGGRETHYKKRNGTHTHTHVIPRRNGGCYIMCVCDRVANNERCEKKERTERKGSSLLILIRNDKGKKPKKNQKKNKKGIHFHSRYGVGWWRGKRTLVAASSVYWKTPTDAKGKRVEQMRFLWRRRYAAVSNGTKSVYMYGWWAVPLLFFFPSKR